MRRFLVVGCGGSGAVTLSYMMDQIKSDLSRVGIDTFPPGWQFVTVDVPTAPGGLPSGLRNVRDQGGSYVGTAPQGEQYAVLDNALTHRLRQRGKLAEIATWAPNDPPSVPVPVTTGAGQFRAIGRMITLNQVTTVAQKLQASWERLNETKTTTAMRGLRFPGSGAFEPNNPPLVLVVSSMAGGAGASMALDVCRLLTMITNLDPRTIGVFMVAADVFDNLGKGATTGVRPNALAMLGEIIASQLGATRNHDVELLSALGMQRGVGAAVPFARVFPVSRTMGANGTPFGDGSQEAIYRGLGRGLAGLMMSGRATDQFVDYDLTNSAGVTGEAEFVGWGAQNPGDLAWGSYGFASLSMGRDRYAEYAAQRLARSSVDLLMDGHLDPLSQASDEQQIDAILDSQWGTVLTRTGLGNRDIEPKAVLEWLRRVLLPAHDVDRMIDRIVEDVLRPAIPAADGRHARQWVPDIYATLEAPALRKRVTDAAVRAADIHAFGWYGEVKTAIENQIADAVATYGLPYATAMAERIATHLGDNLRPGAEAVAKRAPANVLAPTEAVERTLRGLRGQINHGTPIIDSLMRDYRPRIMQQIYAALGEKIADLSRGMVTDVMNPLREALDHPHRVLRAGRDKQVQDTGLAVLATDQYNAWPTDTDTVPRRFFQAENEVMLTPPEEFAAQYTADLPRAVAGDATTPPQYSYAVQAAATTTITGLWSTRDGSAAPGVTQPLIERTGDWRPRTFVLNPATGEQLPPPSPARYEVHLRSDELLTRARLFVARTGESFERFVAVSLREFVSDQHEREWVRAERRDLVVARFVETLQLARPLAAVNTEALSVLHPDQPLGYRFKFSSVPFSDIPIADHLLAEIRNDPEIEQTVQQAFEAALNDEDGLKRIDVFGSFPNYLPLAFRSALDPAARQWDASTIGQQAEFWKWRRARTLPAALPMTEAERHTMVAGWFLGCALGLVDIPPEPYDKAVRVWDCVDLTWLEFPYPLLTPPVRRGPNDWLPAVLESILLAMAHAHDAPALHSMYPYRALRRIYDDSPEGPAAGLASRSAEALVTEWLRTGRTGAGATAAVDGDDVETRAKSVTAWLAAVRADFGDTYLPGGTGEFATITTRTLAARTPLVRDLADDIHAMTDELCVLIGRCAERLQKQNTKPKVKW